MRSAGTTPRPSRTCFLWPGCEPEGEAIPSDPFAGCVTRHLGALLSLLVEVALILRGRAFRDQSGLLGLRLSEEFAFLAFLREFGFEGVDARGLLP